jgi:hypothetical protein
MSVRSFHSVFMATAVAGAALGCYLVSLRVASERAALEAVETRIVSAQREIRLLQTEIGTRGRLAQLERWNVRVLALSAPSADQILGDKFQLARLVRPEHKLDVEAPVVLASAPALPTPQPLAEEPDTGAAPAPTAQLLHEASVKFAPGVTEPVRQKTVTVPPKSAPPVTAAKEPALPKKVAENKPKPATAAVTKPVRTARADPLAPLPSQSTAKASRTDR